MCESVFFARKGVFLGILLYHTGAMEEDMVNVAFERYVSERQIRNALAMQIMNIGEILPKVIERDEARGIKNNPLSEPL